MDAGPAFGWPIWLYFWLGGVAGGAVAAASVANLTRPERFRALGWLSVVLALPLLAVSLVLLVFDLGRPERFLNLLLDWRPMSPLWWGTWILGASVAAYGLVLLRWRFGWPRAVPVAAERALLWLNLFLAGALVVYTGVLLAQTSRPLWNSTWLVPALFAVSALSTGVAALDLAARWAGPRAARAALGALHRADTVLVVLEAAVLAGFVAWLLWLASPAAARAVAVVVRGELAPVFWLGVVVAGLVAPLLLAVAYERRWARRLVAWVGPTLVLVGGLALRYTIVVGGQLGGLS